MDVQQEAKHPFSQFRSLRRLSLGLIALLNLGGCVTTQLRVNTNYLGGTVSSITQKQIIDNLETFADYPFTIPSEFVLGSGSASISNQFTPSTPSSLPAMFTGHVLKGLSLQDQNQTALGWAITPVTDYSDLQRLTALYKYALGQIGLDTFMELYNEAQAPVSNGVALMSPTRHVGGQEITQGDVSGGHVYFYLPQPPVPMLNATGTLTIPSIDDWTLPLPPSGFIATSRSAAYLKNPDSYEPMTGTSLFMLKSHGWEYMHNFTLWVLGATPNTEQGVSGPGGKQPKAAGSGVPPPPPPQSQ